MFQIDLMVTPVGQFQPQQLPELVVPKIPQIIHQTWKDDHLPPHLAAFQQTWQEHHPDWEYRLWTDADNREFLATHYPWFLPIYDGYAHFICRVDAIRYFWLDHYGGVYVDLDFECLSPIDSLLADRSILLSLEPEVHTQSNQPATTQKLDIILSPALMASTVGHPFWQHLWQQLITAQDCPDPLDSTGPFLLTRAYQSYAQNTEIRLIPAEQLHPISVADSHQGQLFNLAVRQEISNRALAIHHWLGSWWHGKAAQSNDLIVKANVSVIDRDRAISNTKFSYRANPAIPQQLDLLPQISCLMVTKNHPKLAKRSIFCFLQQTYPHKELVIIDDGESNELAEFVQQLHHPQITYDQLSARSQTLDELRNMAIAKATGTYLCQWADDHLSDPLRLELQMAVIQTSRADGCLLDRIYLWWPQQQRLAKSLRQMWGSTLLCRQDIFPDYPLVSQREDPEVIQFLIQNHRMATLDLPKLYVNSCHQNNTRDRQNHDIYWESAQVRFEQNDYLRSIQKLARRLPIHSYLQSLTIDKN
jgi:mannosyltransferase OCH1-like enzyme